MASQLRCATKSVAHNPHTRDRSIPGAPIKLEGVQQASEESLFLLHQTTGLKDSGDAFQETFWFLGLLYIVRCRRAMGE